MFRRTSIRLVPQYIFERWILVAYLIINWDMKRLRKHIEFRPDEEFYGLLQTHIDAYINEGQMPPEQIAPAILNLADDHMAGRAMNLRAGDYISLQNFLRQ